MKKLIVIFFLFSAFSSQAQNNLDKITGFSSITASVAYSLRQLSSNYSGPLVRIKVGASFYDVYPEASTTKFSLSSKISAAISTYNAAVVAASGNALSSIITAGTTNATVAIWYDQSGNGVHVYSINATAKIITAGSIETLNGQPTVKFSTTDSFFESTSTVNYSSQSGATVSAIAQNAATSSFGGIIGTANGQSYPGYNTSYSSGVGYQSDANGCGYGTNVLTNDPKMITSIFINTTTNLSKIYVNGVLKTNTAVTANTCSLTHTSGSKIYIGAARGVGSYSFNGNISEAIIFPNQMSAGNQTLLETNQTEYYFSPYVTITSSASGAVCAGTSVTFTATPYNFTGTPTYQWYKNGAVISGETNATYSTSTLANADQIYVIASAVTSNSLNANITAGPSAVVSMLGDGCINKTTLSTPAGQTSYAWYKDNVAISNTNSNTYFPTTAGDYKVQVTSGSCSTQSTVTTISTCGVTADGRMRAITSPTTLVSHEGGVNFGTGVSELGTTVNATGISTTLGTIGATTAVVSGVISSTNALTTSIGVIYSTDSNFGTYSTSSTQSNVAAGTYAFNLSGLTATTTYYTKSFIVNKAGISYGSVVNFTTSSPPKAVGDYYGDGIIFYILKDTDTGYDANVQHGLIAKIASSTSGSTAPGGTNGELIAEDPGSGWTSNGLTTFTGATGDALFAGKSNTTTIISVLGTTSAAYSCANYISKNYNDWYMPSSWELDLLLYYHITRMNAGGSRLYTSGNYISSTDKNQPTFKTYYSDARGGWDGPQNSKATQRSRGLIPIRSF